MVLGSARWRVASSSPRRRRLPSGPRTDALSVTDYEVVTPVPVRKLIDALAGKRAGYQRVSRQLERGPCAPELRAYRPSGPLEAIVCGVHLDRGFRLAFTMQLAE